MPAGLVGQCLVAEFITLHVTKDPWESVSTLARTEDEGLCSEAHGVRP